MCLDKQAAGEPNERNFLSWFYIPYFCVKRIHLQVKKYYSASENFASKDSSKIAASKKRFSFIVYVPIQNYICVPIFSTKRSILRLLLPYYRKRRWNHLCPSNLSIYANVKTYASLNVDTKVRFCTHPFNKDGHIPFMSLSKWPFPSVGQLIRSNQEEWLK